MPRKKTSGSLDINGLSIAVYSEDFQNDFISLSDIARYQSDEPSGVIANWLRNRDTIEFLGLWESLNNPAFNSLEFEGIRSRSGLNAFTISPKKWVALTGSIGIETKGGRYGGTFAHTDIAFEFASWISAEFKLYLIRDYKRLKSDESSRLSLGWNLNREMSKLNYRIHTDAIKENLIPESLTKQQISHTYAGEADLLNVALFGMTAKEWRTANPDQDGNIRDHASIQQLLILANMESYNAVLIREGQSQPERIIKLRSLVETQARSLAELSIPTLPPGEIDTQP